MEELYNFFDKTFGWRYGICLHKMYFEKGMNLTSYFKILLYLFGLTSVGKQNTLVLLAGVSYGILCYLLGYLWFKCGFAEAEIEVGNRFNLFVREVREKLSN